MLTAVAKTLGDYGGSMVKDMHENSPAKAQEVFADEYFHTDANFQNRRAQKLAAGRTRLGAKHGRKLISLALQLHFVASSESMGGHDSGDHGWREHRLRRR